MLARATENSRRPDAGGLSRLRRHHEELDVAHDRSVELFDAGGNRSRADAVTIASVQIA